MGVFRIGGQRVGIVTDVVTVVTEFMEPVVDREVVVWWDGCVFEVQTMRASPDSHEVQAETVTTSEVAVVVGPVAGDQIPTVDDDGNPAPLAVSDLTANRALRYDGRKYVMRGDAVLHKDIHGRPDHAECLCEHQEG